MAHLSGFNILIVDGPSQSACQLRAMLIDQGCNVHVVGSFRSALMVAHRKRVDTVFVEYSESEETRQFCAQLAAMKIPHIYTASSIEPHMAPRPALKSVRAREIVASIG